jgi:hypothetical protein
MPGSGTIHHPPGHNGNRTSREAKGLMIEFGSRTAQDVRFWPFWDSTEALLRTIDAFLAASKAS